MVMAQKKVHSKLLNVIFGIYCDLLLRCCYWRAERIVIFNRGRKNVSGNFHRHVHCLLLKMVTNVYSGNNMLVKISIDGRSFLGKCVQNFPNHFLNRDKCR